MLLQMEVLAPHHAGNDIGHAVVVASFLVLIPGCAFPRLGRPFPRLVGGFEVVRQQTAAAGAGDDLIAIIRDGGIIAEGTSLLSSVCSAHRLCGIFNQKCAMGTADCLQLIHLGWVAVQMRGYHQLDVWIELKCVFQRNGVHIPGSPFRVDKHWDAAFIDHGIYRSGKGHVRAKDALSLQSTVANGRLPIEPLSGQLHA